MLLGLYLGLRREEIARVRWDRFSPEFEWYTVDGESGTAAVLPVHPVLKEKLPPHMGAYPWVFPGRFSAHVSAGTIGTWIGCVGTAAGLDGLSPHRLRPTDTAIATINDATGDLRAAQEFARHADPATTRIYTRVTAERLRRAIDTLDYLNVE